MKFCLTFKCPSPISVPFCYNHILQAALLNWLQDKEYTTFLHDEGYQRERRTFKLYSFSKLYGCHREDKGAKKLIFDEDVSVFISSYVEDMRDFVEASIEAERPLRLGDKLLPLESVYVVEDEFEDCYVRAVSPITIHSTFQLPTGTKRTYYYRPDEKDFSAMLRDNLMRKYRALYDKDPEDVSFSLIPLKDEKLQKKVVKYRDTVIIGWSGIFYMSGSKELIKLALLAGVGARNSMGFGCLLQLTKNEDMENDN